ncbi:MAG: hypothetical protein PHS59_10255 [Paludibacter sp.]|nr:hypothetical protein [Paludibacter sp.]
MKTLTFKSIIISLVLLIGISQVSAATLTGIRIDVIGSRYSDQAYFFSVATCTRYFDNGWDGYKMIGTNTLAPVIYGDEPGGKFQVDAIPDLNETYIAFRAGEDTEYTLSFYSENLTLQYSQLYLVDLENNNTVDLMTTKTYTFSVAPTTDAVQRFKLITSLPVAVIDPVVETPVVDPAVETPVVEPEVETPVADTVVVEIPSVDTVVETPVVEPEVETPVVDTVVVVVPSVEPEVETPITDEVVPEISTEEPADTVQTEASDENPVVVEDGKTNNGNNNGKNDNSNKKDKNAKSLKITTSRQSIYIENTSKNRGQLNVINARSGRIEKSMSFNNGQTIIDANVPSGTYIITASTKDEEISEIVVLR